MRKAGEKTVELYGIWDGDFAEAPKTRGDVSLQRILDSDFHFKEQGFYRVSMESKPCVAPVPELIVVGHDTVGGTVKPYSFYKRYRRQGAPWIYLVQNNIPHCCINSTKPFMLDWLQEVIRIRRPNPKKPLLPIDLSTGWYGSIQPCEVVYKDHWGLPLWNVCDAHVERSEKALPSQEMPAGFFPTESLAHEWLTYIKQQDHPKNSFPRPNDPAFGEPEELRQAHP